MQKGVQVTADEICKLLGIDTDKYEVEVEWNNKEQTLCLSYEEPLPKEEVVDSSKKPKESRYKLEKKRKEKGEDKKDGRLSKVKDEDIIKAYNNSAGKPKATMLYLAEQGLELKYPALTKRIKKLRDQELIE